MSGLSPASKLVCLIGAAIAVFPAQAEEFSWQLSGVAQQFDVGNLDADSWAVDATYYLNPLDDSAGPYALASFLNPTTRVSANASRDDWPRSFDDPKAFTLSGAYVLPGRKWYVGANYAKSDALFPTLSDPEGYGALAGRYLGANTTLELGLNRSEQSYEGSLGCPPGVPICIPFMFPIDETTDSVDLEVFHVRRFRSLTYSLQGSVSQTDTERDTRAPASLSIPPFFEEGPTWRVYSAAGEIFPTTRLGVRIGYSRPDGDAGDADTYDVAATWFFKPRVAVQFSLSRTTIDDVPFDIGASQSAAVRFIGRL